MRFVAIKSVEQQAARGVERSRDLLVKQHTQLMNSVRSQLAELGIIAPQGRRGFIELTQFVSTSDCRIPGPLLAALRMLIAHIEQLGKATAALERQIVEVARAHPAMRQLATIPGVGPLTAHAIVTAIGDGKQFASARDFAAWCGLTRRVDQSADKRRERGISRQGEMRLRKLLALGASTVMRQLRSCPARATAWQHGILARRPIKVAVLAQAAKKRPHRLGHAAARSDLSKACDCHRSSPYAGRITLSDQPPGKEPKDATAKCSGPGSETPLRHRAAKRVAMLGARSA